MRPPAGYFLLTYFFMSRWFKFNAVGLLGVGVQLAALRFLAFWLGPAHYLWATGLAVETAICHNFIWHVHWTWRDRPADRRGTLRRLLRFHLSNGLNSLIGNILLTNLFVICGLPLLVANLCAIGVCALVNYFLGEFYVFRPTLKAD